MLSKMLDWWFLDFTSTYFAKRTCASFWSSSKRFFSVCHMIIKYSWHSYGIQAQFISKHFWINLESSFVLALSRARFYQYSKILGDLHAFRPPSPSGIFQTILFFQWTHHMHFGIHENFALVSADIENPRE